MKENCKKNTERISFEKRLLLNDVSYLERVIHLLELDDFRTGVLLEIAGEMKYHLQDVH